MDAAAVIKRCEARGNDAVDGRQWLHDPRIGSLIIPAGPTGVKALEA